MKRHSDGKKALGKKGRSRPSKAISLSRVSKWTVTMWVTVPRHPEEPDTLSDLAPKKINIEGEGPGRPYHKPTERKDLLCGLFPRLGCWAPSVERDGSKESVWRNGDSAIRPGCGGSESNWFDCKDPDMSQKDASSMKALEYTNTA